MTLGIIVPINDNILSVVLPLLQTWHGDFIYVRVYQIYQHYGRHFICYKAYIMQSFTGIVQLTKLEYKY